jgi:hypothetical protein
MRHVTSDIWASFPFSKDTSKRNPTNPKQLTTKCFYWEAKRSTLNLVNQIQKYLDDLLISKLHQGYTHINSEKEFIWYVKTLKAICKDILLKQTY